MLEKSEKNERFLLKKTEDIDKNDLINNNLDHNCIWRKKYFDLLSEFLKHEETFSTLLDENKVHQEYIINLENKTNKILTTCNQITTNFYNSLENYNSSTHLSDYQKQLELLNDEKNQSLRNNNILQHQLLQKTIMLTNLNTKLQSLLKFIENENEN